MRLLLDQNLSYRLIEQLKDMYPDSSHVRLLGLEHADDEAIWEYARQHNYIVVTHDSDFYERSLLFGFPPRIIWLRCGNTSTSNILRILRGQHERLMAFERDEEASCLQIS